MKTIITKFLAMVLMLALVFSLAGCESLDYRKAIDLFNRGKYDAAAEAFALLDGYEDSDRMISLSNYWAAITLMEEGKYTEALPRFIKLKDYEDSALRVTECTYQIALADFEAGSYGDARIHFEKVADYKQATEYLRRIHWQMLSDAISEHPIEKEKDGKYFSIYTDPACNALVLSVKFFTDTPFSYDDEFYITLTRDSIIATFDASSDFSMTFIDGPIGSVQCASGRMDITTCTPETPLVMESFSKITENNLGEISKSTNPADSLMNETMAENMYDLMTAIPQMLAESGIAVTLQDIGFFALV